MLRKPPPHFVSTILPFHLIRQRLSIALRAYLHALLFAQLSEDLIPVLNQLQAALRRVLTVMSYSPAAILAVEHSDDIHHCSFQSTFL
jgi:hypothetical protein